MENINEGSFVMGTTSEGIVHGVVEHIMIEGGVYGVPGTEYAIQSMPPENPAMAVRIYKEEDGKWKPTAYSIGMMYKDAEAQDINDHQMENKTIKDYHGMGKAESVRVGQMVSWNSSGGRAEGKVRRVLRSGSYKVPNSDFTISGTEDSPAAVIELYRDGKPTKIIVGHKVETLSVKKSLWLGSFDPRGISKNG